MKLAAAIALACIPTALAQVPASPTAQDTILSTRSTLIVVPALVRNKAGELVFTLSAKDFVLTDDGIEQKITLEEDTGGEPLALIVVVETGGAGARQLDKYHTLGTMIDSIAGNVKHKIAVVEFDSEPRLFQSFTSDPNTVQDAMDGLTPGDNGTAILDGLAFALDLLRKQPPEYRRAILLLSETVDRSSHTKLSDALNTISDTNTAIYSIGFSTGRSEASHYAARELPTQSGGLGWENPHPNPPHGCMGKDPDPDPDASTNKAIQAYDCLTQLAPPLALAKMAALIAMNGLRTNIPESVATLTGGEFFKLGDRRSLEHSLLTISNHMPNRYVLTFQPQSPHPGLHAINLRLPNYPGLTITARSSYSPASEPIIEPHPEK
jgi:VWFA-related protein